MGRLNHDRLHRKELGRESIQAGKDRAIAEANVTKYLEDDVTNKGDKHHIGQKLAWDSKAGKMVWVDK